MAEVDERAGTEAYLLKECYMLAGQYEENKAAQSILYSREQKVTIPDGFTPDRDNLMTPNSSQHIVSSILYALTTERAIGTTSADFDIQQMISSLPDCGEKEYLYAIYALKKGRNETQRLDALKHVSLALLYSPNDPRYITLAEILQQFGG